MGFWVWATLAHKRAAVVGFGGGGGKLNNRGSCCGWKHECSSLGLFGMQTFRQSDCWIWSWVDRVVIDVIWLQKVDQLWVYLHDSNADAETAGLNKNRVLLLMFYFRLHQHARKGTALDAQRTFSFFYGCALCQVRRHRLCFLFWWKSQRRKCCSGKIKKHGCNQSNHRQCWAAPGR